MSRFPDFMHMDLTKVTCGGCFLILSSFLLAFAVAVGGGLLLLGLFPDVFNQGKPDRWLMAVLLIAGFAVAAGFFQLGRLLFRRLGLRIYRDEREEP